MIAWMIAIVIQRSGEAAFAALVVMSSLLISCSSGEVQQREQSASKTEAQSLESSERQISGLIRQLASDSISERESAHHSLLGIGQRAVPYLTQSLLNNDLEVVSRVKAILKYLNRRPNRGSPAEGIVWTGFFGQGFGRKDAYCLQGSGFFLSPSSSETSIIISKWLQNHPKARTVAIATVAAGGVAGLPKDVNLVYVWIEDDTDNLNIHLVETGCCAGDTMVSAAIDMLIADAEYSSFLYEVVAAQKRARKASIGIWSPDSDVLVSRGDRFLMIAGACLFEKQYAEAIGEFRNALGSGASPGPIWLKIAECYEKLGDYPAALSSYDKAIAESQSRETYFAKAVAISRHEGPKSAVKWLDELQEKKPENPTYSFVLGSFHKRAGRLRDAVKAYLRCMDKLCKCAGFTLDEKGNLVVGTDSLIREEHLADLLSVVQELSDCYLTLAEPDQVLRYATLGISTGRLLRRNMGCFDENEIESGDVQSRLIRARVHLTRGQSAEAREDLKAARILAEGTRDSEGLKVIKSLERNLRDSEPGRLPSK